MSFGREIKRRLKAVAAPLIFLALVGYFGWNVVQGDHGLVAYAQRQAAAGAGASVTRPRRRPRRKPGNCRVSGLRSSHIDADTLDERARAMLNLADPSDIIVPYSPQDRLF